MTAPLLPPLRWPAEALWETLAPSLPGFTVEILAEIDSSNSELMRRFRGAGSATPQTAPTLLVAEQQTAGRGRLGRNWHSQRADSLTFSLGLPLLPADWSGLSLVVGISLAESLDPFPPAAGHSRIGLKWPNDLWLTGPEGERKMGGILVETASWEGVRYLVVGVGINIRPVDFTSPVEPMEVAPAVPALPPGCLQDLLPGIDAAQALLRVVPPLVQALQAFEQFGFAPFQARFGARDVLAGRNVQLTEGKHVVTGSAHGVAENGALLVLTASGMKAITSSEVSVRPTTDTVTAQAKPKASRPC